MKFQHLFNPKSFFVELFVIKDNCLTLIIDSIAIQSFSVKLDFLKHEISTFIQS